ncbi:MAG: ornithine cyclodeaminase, partial [Rhodothermia bacterium]|nr:ornithine cyclodeaminase [Rhodothermia bacterium]
IVCTATSSSRPVFDASDVTPGTHINGVGSFRPDMIEVPPATVRKAVLIVDHRESCLAEAGDVLAPYQTVEDAAAAIHAELGDVVLGRAGGRPDDDAVTFFKSVGNAVQDLYAASHVVERAETEGCGHRVRI